MPASVPRTAAAAPLAIAILAALLLAPAAPAQVQSPQVGTFGTQVKLGDLDYVPLTKRASVAVRVAEADLGQPGVVTDNCVLLLQDNTDSGAARATAVVAPPPAAQAPRTDVYAKDIRIVPCLGKAAGTAVTDADVVEQNALFVQRAAEVRYADGNGDGKFGRGDAVYLTTMTGASRGLAATTGTGAWTLRLTPAGGKDAGTFVFPTDPDFISHRTVATGATPPAGGGLAARTFSLVEREGNGWYVVPASAGFAAQMAVPVNSVRIGLAGTPAQQPAVSVSSVDLPAKPPVGGETYKLAVRVANDGNGAGAGLVVTRVAGAVADARMTPLLGPAESWLTIIPIVLPAEGGEVPVQVGDSKLTLDVEPGEGAGEDPAALVQALEARVAQLEAQAQAQAKAASSSPSVQPATASVQGAPGLGALAPLAALGLGIAVLRRRAD